MSELHLGLREVVAVLIAVSIIVDVAAWRSFEPPWTGPRR